MSLWPVGIALSTYVSDEQTKMKMTMKPFHGISQLLLPKWDCSVDLQHKK